MSSHPLKITALGSSFAAGASIPPITSTTANRSGSNYASLLAHRLNATLTDLTASGSTLLNVLSDPQTFPMTGETFPPALSLLPTDSDIITLTAGGNDIKYTKGMITDSIPPGDSELRDMLDAMNQLDTVPAATLAQVRDRFLSIIDAIRAKAPQAKIYLVEYLSVFGPASHATQNKLIPLTREQQQKYIDQAAGLAKAYQDAAAARPGVECVPMAAFSEGHCVGSEEPWMEGFDASDAQAFFRGPAPYHPNRAGHEAMAGELERKVLEWERVGRKV